jgi:hypothetical protein
MYVIIKYFLPASAVGKFSNQIGLPRIDVGIGNSKSGVVFQLFKYRYADHPMPLVSALFELGDMLDFSLEIS